MVSSHASAGLSSGSLAVQVCDSWVDDFCEEVGSLTAALQALARISRAGPAHGLVAESLGRCVELQRLLNRIPVWSGMLPLFPVEDPNSVAESVELPWAPDEPWSNIDELGDCFPEFGSEEECELPVFDDAGCDADEKTVRGLRTDFRERVGDELRQLEVLSLGHDWRRMTRLAEALKDTAVKAAAPRIVADAAALQGAARHGCRGDIDRALAALRRDLNECERDLADLHDGGSAVCWAGSAH